MYKNIASQKWTVFAFDRTTNDPIEDDEGQISAVIEIDGVENAVDDTHPTQMTTKKGYYQFDITQAETNGDLLTIIPTSSTADIQVVGVPGSVYTNMVKAAVNALNDVTVADIIAGIADGAYDLQEMIRIIFAACSGKSDGGGSPTLHFRDSGDIKDRITATVDVNGDRTAIALDGS